MRSRLSSSIQHVSICYIHFEHSVLTERYDGIRMHDQVIPSGHCIVAKFRSTGTGVTQDHGFQREVPLSVGTLLS